MDSTSVDDAASQQLSLEQAKAMSISDGDSNESASEQDTEMSDGEAEAQGSEDVIDADGDYEDDDDFIPRENENGEDDNDDDFIMDLDGDQATDISEDFAQKDSSDDEFEDSPRRSRSQRKGIASESKKTPKAKPLPSKADRQASRLSGLPASHQILIPKRTNPESRQKFPSKKSSAKMFRWEAMWGKNVETIKLGLTMANIYLKEISVPSHANLYSSAFYSVSREHDVNAGLKYCIQDRAQSGFEKLKVSDAERYLASASTQDSFDIFLGPLRQGGPPQSLYKIPMMGCIALNQEKLYPHKNGSVLNVGGEIAALNWAPRKPSGAQYIAISTMSKHRKENKSNGPLAFSRLTSQACIQFWKCKTDDSKQRIVSTSLPLIYCVDWGAAVKLVWRPGVLPTESENEIGLLLAIFEDGKARIFNINEVKSNNRVFAKIEKPLFEMYLKDTIITCATWVEASIIVAGCANGMVAGWDLSCLTPENAHLPVFYHNLHQTYINEIITLYPTLPYHVSAVSFDGRFSVHDIRNPQHSVVFNARSRSSVFTPNVVWMDRVQSILYSDEPNTIKCWNVRKADSGLIISDGVGEVMAGSCGGGGYHGFLIFGTKDGRVRLINVLRKIMLPKGTHWEQVWFKLEHAKKTGAFRILEGFLTEQFRVTKNQPPTTTIYEDKSDITAVSWNPNRIFGTWAAIALGCGLVRIEDICSDVNEPVPAEEDAVWIKEKEQ